MSSRLHIDNLSFWVMLQRSPFNSAGGRPRGAGSFVCKKKKKDFDRVPDWFTNNGSERVDSLFARPVFDPTAQVGFSLRSRQDDEVVSKQRSVSNELVFRVRHLFSCRYW